MTKTIYNPPRPTVTDEIILQAATQLMTDFGMDGDPATLAEQYSHGIDGYELAKKLDLNCGWDISATEVEALDSMNQYVDDTHLNQQKKWFVQNSITPPLPIGTRIKLDPRGGADAGEIKGINQHWPAYYNVKEDGCTDDNCSLLIKFEEAQAI